MTGVYCVTVDSKVHQVCERFDVADAWQIFYRRFGFKQVSIEVFKICDEKPADWRKKQ